MEPKKLFGTDGIRAPFTSQIFNQDSILRLGKALAKIILKISKSNYPKITIARDTRASGLELEKNIINSLTRAGITCDLLGVLPTSGLSVLTREHNSDLGIMISASHNPHDHNGFKFFQPNGLKITRATELLIENEFIKNSHINLKNNLSMGKTKYINNAQKFYLDYLSGYLNKLFTQKIKIKLIIDCAHGAASDLAPRLFKKHLSPNYNVIVLGDTPNGQNINLKVGSEYPTKMQSLVKNSDCDLGIAFDGDADRVMFVDSAGEIIDGDAILALLALYFKKNNLLNNNLLITTIMSSMALEKNLEKHNIKVIRTDVGDRNVVEAMIKHNSILGGENSGHLIKSPELGTGDGLFFGLLVAQIISQSSKSISELLNFYQPIPKLLTNIPVKEKIALSNLPKTRQLILATQEKLGKTGRVFFRYSGTESKARLFVEAPTQELCLNISQSISNLFKRETVI